MEIITTTFLSYLPQLLVAVVWVVAAILAIVRWRRHPKVSLLTIIAVGILLGATLISTFISSAVPLLMDQLGGSLQQYGTLLVVSSLIFGVVRAGAWILIVMAIFGWRLEPEIQ